MLQTTNNVFNNSLLQYVTPQSLLAWHRVRLANLMAQNGEEWADVYKQYNSGIMFSYTSVCTVAKWFYVLHWTRFKPSGWCHCSVVLAYI